MKIMAVRGAFSPHKLGITLSHEHLLNNALSWFTEPTDVSKKILADAPITIETLGMLRTDVTISKDNLKLDNVNDAITELVAYKISGGNSIVEVTLPGVGRAPQALKKISEVTKINIICSTGWYTADTHPPIVKEKNVDDLSTMIIRELTEGIGATDIKAGIIKCGCSSPLRPEEKKVMKAAAKAQEKTGAPFTIHPGTFNATEKKFVAPGDEGHKYLRIIKENGGDLQKLFISHMDGMFLLDIEQQRAILDKGAGINYDCFGHDFYFSTLAPGILPISDRERVAALAELCRQGYDKQIMLSHDTCIKIQWTKYGGLGYTHILKNIVPALKRAGVTEKQINRMLIDNPKRVLAF